MAKKLSAFAVVLYGMATLYGAPGFAATTPPCENVSPTDVAAIAACLEAKPVYKQVMTLANATVMGCAQVKGIYARSIPRAQKYTNVPSCETLAEVMTKLDGKKPVWHGCATYFARNKNLNACVKGIVLSMRPERRAATTCQLVQRNLTMISRSMLPPNAASYKAPGCDVIEPTLDKTIAQRQARTPAPSVVAKSSKPAANGNNPALKPQNQLRAGTSNVVYQYRDSPYNTQIQINGTYGGACAPKTYVMVTHFLRHGKFELANYPDAIKDIISGVKTKCPETNNIVLLHEWRETLPQKMPNVMNYKYHSDYYQATAKSGWKLKPMANPLDAYPLDEAVVFDMRGRSRLIVDDSNRVVHGLIVTNGPPVSFKGSYEPFEANDRSRTVRVDYTIVGKWFGYGDERNHCDKPRDGYAWWGAFKLLGEKRDMIFYPCTSEAESTPTNPVKPETRNLVFWEQDDSLNGFRTSYPKIFNNKFNPVLGSVIRGDPKLETARVNAEYAKERKVYLAEEQKRSKPGLVYKTENYWIERLIGTDRAARISFQNDGRQHIVKTIKDTFDGAFKGDGHFPLIYRYFARKHGERCTAYLENPIKVTITTIEKDGYGFEKSRSTLEYIIDQRFKAAYDRFGGAEVKNSLQIVMGVAGSTAIPSVDRMFSMISFYPQTVDTILGNISCESATMRQLNENMWRRGNLEPSLQAAGLTIAGAEKETEIAQLRKMVMENNAALKGTGKSNNAGR